MRSVGGFLVSNLRRRIRRVSQCLGVNPLCAVEPPSQAQRRKHTQYRVEAGCC
jgi:hypothetical protein